MRHDQRDRVVVAGVAVVAGWGVAVMSRCSRALVARHGLLEDREEAACRRGSSADACGLRPAAGQDLAAAIGDGLAARDAPSSSTTSTKSGSVVVTEIGREGERHGDDVVHREADEIEELAPDVDVDREDVGDHVDHRIVLRRLPACRRCRRASACSRDAVVLADVERHEDLVDVGVEHDARRPPGRPRYCIPTAASCCPA